MGESSLRAVREKRSFACSQDQFLFWWSNGDKGRLKSQRLLGIRQHEKGFRKPICHLTVEFQSSGKRSFDEEVLMGQSPYT